MVDGRWTSALCASELFLSLPSTDETFHKEPRRIKKDRKWMGGRTNGWMDGQTDRQRVSGPRHFSACHAGV